MYTEILESLRAGDKVIIAFNGFLGSLNQSSPFRQMLGELAQKEVNPTVLVPVRNSYDRIADEIGNAEAFGWRVASDESVLQWPAQMLLVDQSGRFSGVSFEPNSSDMQALEADEAEMLWRQFDEMIVDYNEAVGA